MTTIAAITCFSVSVTMNNVVEHSNRSIGVGNTIKPKLNFSWKNTKKCRDFNYLVEHHLSGISLTTGCVDEGHFDYKMHINKFYGNICKIILFSYSSIAAQGTSAKKRSENANWWSYELQHLKKLQ